MLAAQLPLHELRLLQVKLACAAVKGSGRRAESRGEAACEAQRAALLKPGSGAACMLLWHGTARYGTGHHLALCDLPRHALQDGPRRAAARRHP